MSTTQEFVYDGTIPARPDVQPAPVAPAPKRRGRWLALAAAGTIALAIGGGVAADRQGTSTSTPPAVAAPVAPGMTESEAWFQVADSMQSGADELGQVTATSAISQDIIHIHAAAGYAYQAADVIAPFAPLTAQYLRGAAGHLDAAADAEAAGDFDTATAEIQAATSDMSAANDSIPDVGSTGVSI